MFRIIRQTPSKRLEVACPNGDYLWPLPSQLVEWTECPLCLMFTGNDAPKESEGIWDKPGEQGS